MKMTFAVAGDMLVQRRIPADYEGAAEVREHITRADASFVNLETTIHDGEFPGGVMNGGSFLRAPKSALEDLKAFGFKSTSFANNHSADFCIEGLMATKRAVDEAGIPNAGVGCNLDQAAAPAFLDTKNGRVALIATSTGPEARSIMAGKQSRRFPGRPGVNALRVSECLQVTAEQLTVIRAIAEQSHINAQTDIERAEGYHSPLADGVAVLKDLQFVQGDKTAYITHPNAEDMERIEKSIYDAQMQADYILISIHSHELSGDKKESPSDFLVEFAHRCIDAGAHAVIGHGPHLLRPLEIYRGRPIFYSLGDFVIHNECIPFAPEDMFRKQGLTSDATMRELFCNRSANYTRGLMRDRRMLEAVVPYFEMEDGRLTHLELAPIELDFDKKVWQNGNPHIDVNRGIIERYAEMSRVFGTEILTDERGFGIVKL